MRTAVTIIFFFTVLNLSGQSRQLIIQIDSIEAVSGFTSDKFELSITNQGFAGLGDSPTVLKNDFSACPNYIASLPIETDSSNLRIPVDDKHGYLELSGLKFFKGDTIRIPRLEIYSNCHPDTSFIVIVHMKKRPGMEEFEFVKGKRKLDIQKSKCEKLPPDTLTIVINGKNYNTEFKMSNTPVSTVTTGNRVRPKKYFTKDDYSGTIRRMRLESVTKRYLNLTTINLK